MLFRSIDYRGCEPGDAVLERDASVPMTFVRLPKGTFYMGWKIVILLAGRPQGWIRTARETRA